MHRVKGNRLPLVHPIVESPLAWKMPANGRVEINVDATFDSIGNKTGFGVCIRNDQGIFLLGRTSIFTLALLPHEGEALDFHYDILWAQSLNLWYMDIKSDYKLAVDYINSVD